MRPGDLGIDCMHLNLHKTFSTPMAVAAGQRACCSVGGVGIHAPLPWVIHGDDGYEVVEHEAGAGDAEPYGRMKAFHGQMGMFVRALAYMMSHGADGLKQVSSDAVLTPITYWRGCRTN